MKSRISFFNKAIFRKNITRFFPLWVLYTILLLLILASTAQARTTAIVARDLASFIGPMVWLNMGYGFLCALLLMGDLFQGRMCNALHALPMRRETWLGTHIVTGFLFSLVPNVLLTVVGAVLILNYAYLTLFWLAATTLQFLFFFGTALFAAVCAGSRLGMAAVYGIFHFITVLLYALAELFYEPLLYGIRLDAEAFYRYFPLMQLQDGPYLNLQYYPTTLALAYNGIFRDKWIYTGLCAAVGVVFMGLALLVYRRRHLESAGDFLSLRPLRPVFLLLYTLGAGAVIFLFSELFTGELDYVFLAVGLVVGYFTGQMLLSRTVKVFQKKSFLRFAILIAVFGLSLGLTKLDPLGITRIVPKTENVQWASVYSSDYDYYYTEIYKYNNHRVTDPEKIEQLRQFHKLLIADRAEQAGPKVKVNVLYVRKDGTHLTRYYEVPADGILGQQAKSYFSDMGYIFQTNEPAQLHKHIESVSIDCYEQELLEKWGFTTNTNGVMSITMKDPQLIAGLLDAIDADCREGNMAQDWVFYQEELQVFSLDFSFSENGKTNVGGKHYLQVYESAAHTIAYLRDHLEILQ